MSDLTGLVLACDISRAITYQYSGGSNNSSYPSLTGVTTDNHELNHSEPDPQPLSNKITIFTMEQLRTS